MKIKAFIERHFYIFLILCGLSLTSCEFFNKSIPEFLEYYTSEAMVLDYNFNCTVLKNKNSVDCIPSNDIVKVVFNLANLKQYDIDFSYDFDDEFIKSKYVEKDITFNLSADKTSVTMTIKKDFLQKIDKGQAKNAEDEITKNISGTLTLYQLDDSRNRVRPFEMPYSMTLNANSAPSRVENACILADGVSPSSSEDTRNLYICFNLENFKNTVHENDTHKITIAGDEYTISYDSGMVLSSTDTDVNAKLLTSAPLSLYEIAETDSGATKSLPDNSTCKKYYYKLDIDAGHVDKNKKYEIKVTDDWGLSSSASVSANAEKLTQPVITASEYDTNKEKGHIIISHDYKTLAHNDCTGELKIKYSIYDASGDTKGELVVASDPVVMKNGTYDIYVEPGKYIIEATAVCEDYIDSALTTSAVIDAGERSKVYFVSSDGNANNNGSFEYPYPSISECMKAIQKRNASSGDEYTIKLKSDIKEYGIEFNNSHLGSVKKIVLDGCGHSIKANKEWNILSVGSGIDVALTDVTLTGAGKTLNSLEIDALSMNDVSNISVSGNLYLCNGTKIVNNYTVCNGAGSYNSSLISVGASGQLFAEGKVIISGNKYADGSNLASNLYLKSGQVIKCSHKLKDENDNYYSMEGSEIHVSICNASQIVSGVVITSGFGVNSGVAPSSVFVSDQGYAVRWNGTDHKEAAIKSNGNGSVEFETHKKIKIIADNSIVIDDNLSTTFKVYLENELEPINLDSPSIDIFKGGYDTDANGSWNSTNKTGTVTFNSYWPKGTYSICVSAKYNGQDVYGEVPVYFINKNIVTSIDNIIKDNLTSVNPKYIQINSSSEFTVDSANTSNSSVFNISNGTVVVSGNSLSRTKITASDSLGANRMIRVTGSQTNVTFENICFTGEGSVAMNDGKAILVDNNATLTLRNCEITGFGVHTNNIDCSSPIIYVKSGKLIIENCDIHDSSIYSNMMWAGAIRGDYGSQIIIRNSEIHENNGQHTGAGLYICGKCYAVNTKIYGNTSQRGAGVYADTSASLKMVNCEIYENRSDEGGYYKNCGAGLWVKSRDVVLENTEIYSNECSDLGTAESHLCGGGAMFVEGGKVLLRDCTVTDNISSTFGAAFSLYSADNEAMPEIILEGTNTINNNSASYGGALLYVNSEKGAKYNNTVYQNGTKL